MANFINIAVLRAVSSTDATLEKFKKFTNGKTGCVPQCTFKIIN